MMAAAMPDRRAPRWWLILLLVGGCALIAWGMGLIWFLHMIAQVPPVPPPADGIVALTGGAGRIEAALRLAVARPSTLVLITGLGGGADIDALAARAGVDPALLAGRVTLGRSAQSTRGNAVEAEAWARAAGIRSVIVVTAPFHMPRAEVELARLMPRVTLYPYPAGGDAGRTAVPIRVLIGEYGKYLLAVSGVSGLAPLREARGPGQASG